jgi:hypothetical protein
MACAMMLSAALSRQTKRTFTVVGREARALTGVKLS